MPFLQEGFAVTAWHMQVSHHKLHLWFPGRMCSGDMESSQLERRMVLEEDFNNSRNMGN